MTGKKGASAPAIFVLEEQVASGAWLPLAPGPGEDELIAFPTMDADPGGMTPEEAAKEWEADLGVPVRIAQYRRVE